MWEGTINQAGNANYKDMSPLDMVANSINSFRQQQKTSSEVTWVDNLIQSSNQNYFNALTSKDKGTSKTSNSISQIDAYAAIIKAKWQDNWEDWSRETSSKDIIKRYYNEHPDVASWVWERLKWYASSDINPYDFALDEWVVLSPEEEKANKLAKQANSIWVPQWAIDNFWLDMLEEEWKVVDVAWNWVQNLYYWFNSDNPEAVALWAIDNYARRTYWKHIRELDQYEMGKILYDLQDEDLFQEMSPSISKWLWNLWEWVVWAAIEYMYATPTMIFSLLWQIPWVWGVMNTALYEYSAWLWWVINWLVPPLWYYRESLPTDEDKKEWDSFIWWLFMVWMNKRWWTKYDKIVKQDISNFYREYWPTALWDKFNAWKENKGTWEWGTTALSLEEFQNMPKTQETWITTNAEQWKRMKLLNEKSNKIVNSKYVSQNTKVSQALDNLGKEVLDNLKNYEYEEMFGENESYLKKIENYQNTLADAIDTKWWPENDIWEWPDVENRWIMWEAEPNHPIKEFLDQMDIMLKDADPVSRKALDTMHQLYNRWEVTARDLTNFKRILSRQYNLYSDVPEGTQLNVSMRNIETTRQWLNYLLRDIVDWIPEFKETWLWNAFEWTDSAFHPNLYLRWELIKLVNKVNQLKWQIPKDVWKAELWEKAWKATSVKWWFDIVSDWLWGKWKKKMTNALDFQEKLKMHIKDFSKLLDWMPQKQAKVFENAMLDYLNRKWAWPKEVYWWNLWEGEVIDSKWFFDDYFDWESEATRNAYLEDYVTVERPESFMLWEDSKYNGNPVDYTDVTVVDSDSYPWRPWKTTESYKGQKKWEWWTPEEWNNKMNSYKDLLKESWFSDQQADAVVSILEKNWFKIWDQPSLLSDIPTVVDKKTLADIAKEQQINKNKAAIKKSKTSSKKLTQEEIDHLFWKDKTPRQRAEETLKKAKKSWKKSDKK